MNAAPFVGLSRTAGWEPRAGIFRPGKRFSPGCPHHSLGDRLRSLAVYRATDRWGHPRHRGGHQDALGGASDDALAPVQDMGVDHGRPEFLVTWELLDRPDIAGRAAG